VGILRTNIRRLPRPGPLPPDSGAPRTREHRRRAALRLAALWLAALLLLLLPGLGAGETSLGEYSLKAAFIYNFSKFVEWPESAFHGKRDFCIATLGRTPLDRELAALAGKSVQGRSIVFRKLTSLEDAAQCQVLFISRSELAKLEGNLDSIRDIPVLTIAESDDFCKRGGMLSLEKENGKIVFDVNYRETQRSRLKPNSQLLKLARRIYGRP
jgi:hypothetical protein